MKPEIEIDKLGSPNPSPPLHDGRDWQAGGLYFRCVRAACGTIFRLYFKLEVEGFENIPPRGPFIVSPNHQSYLDPFWVSVPFPYPLRYMTWDRFVYMPVIGSFIRTLGAFPVKLESSDRSALRLSLDHLQKGGALMIFPEGGRTRTGKTMPFKPGVIRLALDSNAPIIPVTIVGGYEAFNPHHWVPRPRKVKVIFHPPMPLPENIKREAMKQCLNEQAARLQTIVESGLKR